MTYSLLRSSRLSAGGAPGNTAGPPSLPSPTPVTKEAVQEGDLLPPHRASPNPLSSFPTPQPALSLCPGPLESTCPPSAVWELQTWGSPGCLCMTQGRQ